ncbi:SMU1112c/YaeR family gloxylase I-like metalloprotein [Gracilibacillus salinarum]|uniref:VOC family protein n=1 Tax=Gracilibacillus salinarum TaxID=2932255 RepID=A0ABY4GR99_9BACI|nr:VOC family protein [Gracilibacillus salinarum]UOQ86766.1 VOC family protein [Gracilibacillus salinarum]
MFNGIHHLAIICSNYAVSKDFYIKKLGFTEIREVYREERKSYKLDLALNGTYLLELFSFPDAPERPSYPEAQGLRHLAFTVDNLVETVTHLQKQGIEVEGIRTDPITGKRFTFFQDPDQLPIELYEN